YVKSFTEGLAAVNNGGKIIGENTVQGGKWGFIDNTGKMVIPEQFEDAWGFTPDGLAIVKKTGKWGYIDKTGKMVISATYYACASFNNGFAVVQKEGGFGLINRAGKLLTTQAFTALGDNFFEDMMSAEFGKKWGYIDKTGKMVIPAAYDEAAH